MTLQQLLEFAGVDMTSTKAKKLLEVAQPDQQATANAAKPILAALEKVFPGYVSSDWDRSGYLVVSLSGGPADGNSHSDNPNVMTPQNVSKVIDPFFRQFRQQGWTFTQPQGGKFMLGVPAQQAQPQ